MPNVKRTISLAEAQAAYIDERVASGDYASASEVVREGLLALRDRDESMERWLVEDVASEFDAAMTDPSSEASVREAIADIREELLSRKRRAG